MSHVAQTRIYAEMTADWDGVVETETGFVANCLDGHFWMSPVPGCYFGTEAFFKSFFDFCLGIFCCFFVWRAFFLPLPCLGFGFACLVFSLVALLLLFPVCAFRFVAFLLRLFIEENR